MSRASEIEKALRDCARFVFGEEGEGPSGTYDRVAMEFFHETGIWPPGKSAPMEMHTGDPEDARKAFREWGQRRREAVESRVRAALALPEPEIVVGWIDPDDIGWWRLNGRPMNIYSIAVHATVRVRLTVEPEGEST